MAIRLFFPLFMAGLGLATAANLAAPAPARPLIPTNTFNVVQFGAVGDGKTLGTAAIQKAIDTAVAAGGGMVRVPAGRFLTGPLDLGSGLNLRLDAGAVLLLSDDLENYPLLPNRGRYRDGFSAAGAHDLELSGPGTIDGQGQVWWAAFRTNKAMVHRPYLMRLGACVRLYIHEVTFLNSPMFHLVTDNCTDVTIEGITIRAPAGSPNTDGIDPSGWNYLIRGCTIDVGDDNIAIKPGGGRTPGNQHFRVTRCAFLHGHGMSIGSGSAGGLDDLLVSDCSFQDTDSGIRIKTGRGRGGLAQNLTYTDLTMNGVRNPVYIIDYYPEREAPKDPATEKAEPVTRLTPFNQHILIRNLTATNCPTAGVIRGLPEAPISDLIFSNVVISAASGMKIIHAREVRWIHSRLDASKGPRLTTFDAQVSGLE